MPDDPASIISATPRPSFTAGEAAAIEVTVGQVVRLPVEVGDAAEETVDPARDVLRGASNARQPVKDGLVGDATLSFEMNLEVMLLGESRRLQLDQTEDELIHLRAVQRLDVGRGHRLELVVDDAGLFPRDFHLLPVLILPARLEPLRNLW